MRDDDLYKYLHELRRSTNALKRLKCIPGTLKLEVSPCPEENKCSLTPELAKLHPYPGIPLICKIIFAVNFISFFYKNKLR